MIVASRSRWILLAVLGGCAPVVTHGPGVDPGVTLSATFGTVRPLCDTGCSGDLVPAWAAGARYGFVPADPARPAFLAGLSLPVFDLAAPEADLYLQGPGRSAPVEYGAGVLSSPRHLMPYVQFGSTRGRLGWYVTPAYAWSFSHESPNWGGDGGGSEYHRPPRYWSPAAALRIPTREGTLDLYLAGAFGSVIRNVHGPGQYPEEPVIEQVRQPIRTLMLGVTVATRADRLRLPRVPPPSRPRPPP